MKLSTFSKNATQFYKSGKSMYLRSAPGRGKTSTIIASIAAIAAATEKSIGLSILSGPLLNVADVVGYLVPKHTDDGRVESHYTEPFWARTDEGKRLEDYDGGIIFVDEADKMDVDVKKIMGEMALSGRCGPHKLPDGWVVWMAGNRAGDRSGSTKELDHLINRRFEIDIDDDLIGWEQWALRNNVPPVIVTFAMNNPQIVFPTETPKVQGPFCTPRSLVSTGELLVTMSGKDGTLPDDTDAVEIAAAGIGSAAAEHLFATIRLEQELPSIKSIVSDPDTAPVPVKPDAQMLISYKLAAIADKENIAPLVTYMERLPADFAATFAKGVGNRAPMLIVTPAIQAWAKRNASLIGIMSMLK